SPEARERYLRVQRAAAGISDEQYHKRTTSKRNSRVGLGLEKHEWQKSGACYGTDTNVFFPQRGDPVKKQKAACARCPVVDECLEYALIRSEKFGIWGGLSERQRRSIRRIKASGEASPSEIKELITKMRNQTKPDPKKEDPLEEFDEVFESVPQITE